MTDSSPTNDHEIAVAGYQAALDVVARELVSGTDRFEARLGEGLPTLTDEEAEVLESRLAELAGEAEAHPLGDAVRHCFSPAAGVTMPGLWERLKPLLPALRLWRARRSAKPGLDTLQALDAREASLFEQVALFEDQVCREADHGALALLVSVRIEECLRRWSLEAGAPVWPEVAGYLDDIGNAPQLLAGFFEDGQKASLWLVEKWMLGVKRALRAESKPVGAWVVEQYGSRVTRFEGEALVPTEALARGGFHRFLSRLRVRYRNPLAHGDRMPVDRAEYHRLCDTTFASGCVRHWLELGTCPAWYAPQSPGWLSLLLCAAQKRL